MKQFTCIDLFCGCAGFTLGMARAGLTVLAAIDSNSEAIKVFQKNLPDVGHILEKDLSRVCGIHPRELAALIGAAEVDVIVGGPPCQGYSTVRRRDGTNNGRRMVQDERCFLCQEFLR